MYQQSCAGHEVQNNITTLTSSGRTGELKVSVISTLVCVCFSFKTDRMNLNLSLNPSGVQQMCSSALTCRRFTARCLRVKKQDEMISFLSHLQTERCGHSLSVTDTKVKNSDFTLA